MFYKHHEGSTSYNDKLDDKDVDLVVDILYVYVWV